MQTVLGIFTRRESAEHAIEQLIGSGISPERIVFLSGERPDMELSTVPTTDTERDGMGKTMGTFVGGVTGASAGLGLGSAMASLMVPGVGPILAAGIGAAKFGMKFNFYNNEYRGLSLSVYPQIEFAAPGMGSVRKGLAEPGQTLILPLLVLKEFKYVTFVANGAVNKPLNDPERETTGTFGVGVGRALRRTRAVVRPVSRRSFARGTP